MMSITSERNLLQIRIYVLLLKFVMLSTLCIENGTEVHLSIENGTEVHTLSELMSYKNLASIFMSNKLATS